MIWITANNEIERCSNRIAAAIMYSYAAIKAGGALAGSFDK
jgi:hypothetical protein